MDVADGGALGSDTVAGAQDPYGAEQDWADLAASLGATPGQFPGPIDVGRASQVAGRLNPDLVSPGGTPTPALAPALPTTGQRVGAWGVNTLLDYVPLARSLNRGAQDLGFRTLGDVLAGIQRGPQPNPAAASQGAWGTGSPTPTGVAAAAPGALAGLPAPTALDPRGGAVLMPSVLSTLTPIPSLPTLTLRPA